MHVNHTAAPYLELCKVFLDNTLHSDLLYTIYIVFSTIIIFCFKTNYDKMYNLNKENCQVRFGSYCLIFLIFFFF